MLDIKVRQYFKKWKLYEREWAFYNTVCYESPLIRIERIFSKEDKRKIHNLIVDLYFDFEYDWKPLSNRDLAILYWVNHQTMNNIVNDALLKLKDGSRQHKNRGRKYIYSWKYAKKNKVENNVATE